MNWEILGRWAVVVPFSLGGAFLTGFAIDVLPRDPVTAAMSGMVYVTVALVIAFAVAPSHRRIVLVVLGTLILGDLVVTHLVLPDLLTEGARESLKPLRVVLRVEHYEGPNGGGFARVLGAGVGGILVGSLLLRSRTTSPHLD